MPKCKPDEISQAISGALHNYNQDVTNRIKKSTDKVGREVNKTIKEHVTFKERTGDYIKHFRVATTYEDAYRKTKEWYVAAPHYRLTHLLENGHALKNGGRTRAFPHIRYGQELAERRMDELAKEDIRDAGR